MAMRAMIKELKVDRLDLPLKEPFIIATGRKDAANNVLVRVILDDGTVGFGEVSPSPYTTGETQETCIAVLNHIRWAVLGQDVFKWRALLTKTRRLIRANVGAHSALELAVIDAFTKSIGLPLYQFFGGAITSVETDITLSLGTPDETFAAAKKMVQKGFRKLKVKVGQGVGIDAERIQRVREAAPDAEISLDANQAFSPKDAVELVRRITKAGIEISLIEQPVRKDDIAGMRYVRQNCPIPVAADESIFTPEDAIRIIREDATDVINIKVAKCGLMGALDIAGIARAANKCLMIGCMMESKIGLAASVHLACGLGDFVHCDLDSVYLLKPFECTGGFKLDGPNFSVEGTKRGTDLDYEP